MANKHQNGPPPNNQQHLISKSIVPLQQERLSRLIRLPEVMARVGLSRSTIYNRIADGTFIAPVRLGEKSVAWLESDIDGWIQDRIAQAGREVSA